MKPSELLNNEQFVSELLSNELSVRQLAKKWNVGKSAVGKWRKRLLEKDGLPTTSKVSELKEQHRETWVGNEGEISVVIHEEITHDNILKKFGHDPEQVEIVGVLEQTHWMIDGYPSRYNHRYKFKVRRKVEGEVTPQSIIDDIRNFTYVPDRKPFAQFRPETLVVVPADLQMGKVDWNGGSDTTYVQTMQSFARAAEFAKEFRPAEIVMIDAGDVIENIYSTSSQLGTNDLDLPHQVVAASHVMLEGIKMFAPLAPKVRYAAVSSNHGAHRLGPKSPAGDVHADYGIAIAKMLANALTLNEEAFGHVEIQVPDAYHESLYFETSGSQIGVAHGHQAGRADKLGDWWKGQSHGNMPLSKARIAVFGHYHSLRVQQSGDARWLFVGPSSDRGSSWFTNATGERSQSGMLTFTTSNNEWNNLKIM